MLTFSFEQRLFVIGLLAAVSLVIYAATVPENDPPPWHTTTMTQTAVIPAVPEPLNLQQPESAQTTDAVQGADLDRGYLREGGSMKGAGSSAAQRSQHTAITDTEAMGADAAATDKSCTPASLVDEPAAFAATESPCVAETIMDQATSLAEPVRQDAARDDLDSGKLSPGEFGPGELGARESSPREALSVQHAVSAIGPTDPTVHDDPSVKTQPGQHLQARSLPSFQEGIDDMNDMFISAYWILVLGGLTGMLLGSGDDDSKSSSVSSFLQRILSPSAPRFFTRKTDDADRQEAPSEADEENNAAPRSSPGEKPKLFAGMKAGKTKRLFNPNDVPVYHPADRALYNRSDAPETFSTPDTSDTSETSNTSSASQDHAGTAAHSAAETPRVSPHSQQPPGGDSPADVAELPQEAAASSGSTESSGALSGDPGDETDLRASANGRRQPGPVHTAQQLHRTPVLRSVGNRRYAVERVVDHIVAVQSLAVSGGADGPPSGTSEALDPARSDCPLPDTDATGTRSPLRVAPHPSRPPQRRPGTSARFDLTDPRPSDASEDGDAEETISSKGTRSSKGTQSSGLLSGGSSFPIGLRSMALPGDSDSCLKRHTYSGIHTDGPFPEINDLRAWREIERSGAKQAYMRVTSDVMDPEITRGSVVSLRPSDVFAGESVYAFRMWEAFYVARLLRLPDNQVRVLPVNTIYKPFVLNLATQDVELKGRVTGLFL